MGALWTPLLRERRRDLSVFFREEQSRSRPLTVGVEENERDAAVSVHAVYKWTTEGPEAERPSGRAVLWGERGDGAEIWSSRRFRCS
jgi:hypothetical protein